MELSDLPEVGQTKGHNLKIFRRARDGLGGGVEATSPGVVRITRCRQCRIRSDKCGCPEDST